MWAFFFGERDADDEFVATNMINDEYIPKLTILKRNSAFASAERLRNRCAIWLSDHVAVLTAVKGSKALQITHQ